MYPRDYEILQHVYRHRVTTRDVLKRLFFYPKSSITAVSKVTSRLVSQEWLHVHKLGPVTRYYVLSRKAVQLLGAYPGAAEPLDDRSLVQWYATLLYCCSLPVRRHLFLPSEIEEQYPQLQPGKFDPHFYCRPYDAVDGRIQFIRACTDVETVDQLAGLHLELQHKLLHAEFRQFAEAGGFEVVLASTNQERAFVLQKKLRRNPLPGNVRVEVVVVPKLTEILVRFASGSSLTVPLDINPPAALGGSNLPQAAGLTNSSTRSGTGVAPIESPVENGHRLLEAAPQGARRRKAAVNKNGHQASQSEPAGDASEPDEVTQAAATSSTSSEVGTDALIAYLEPLDIYQLAGLPPAQLLDRPVRSLSLPLEESVLLRQAGIDNVKNLLLADRSQLNLSEAQFRTVLAAIMAAAGRLLSGAADSRDQWIASLRTDEPDLGLSLKNAGIINDAGFQAVDATIFGRRVLSRLHRLRFQYLHRKLRVRTANQLVAILPSQVLSLPIHNVDLEPASEAFLAEQGIFTVSGLLCLNQNHFQQQECIQAGIRLDVLEGLSRAFEAYVATLGGQALPVATTQDALA